MGITGESAPLWLGRRFEWGVCGLQRVPIPPSIWRSLPTVNADSSEARKTIARAISLGVPKRPAGTMPWMEADTVLRSDSDRPSLLYRGVDIGPGLTAFTRMPREISSPESVRVR